MFSFWIVTVFTLVNALLFFGGTLLTDITSNNALSKSKKRIINTLITAIAVFAVTCMPWEGGGIYKRLDWLYYTSGTFFLLVLPLLIILGAKLRKWINGKSFLLLTLFIVPLLSFVGCYDRVEIEDRTFVVAFGIDKAEDDGDTIPYRYTMSVALSHNGSGGDDEKDDNKNQIKTASAQTLTEAIHLLNREANARLYYGQAKVIVLGSELLEDPALVKNAFIVLAQNEEIDRQIKIVSAEGKATDALKEKPHEKIPKANAVNYTPDFGEVHTQLKQSGCALIPVYSGGATALKDYKKTETLSAEELRGFLWCLPDKNKDAVITAGENDGKHISYKMKKHSVDISIEPSCPNPRVIIEVKAEGRLTEADGLAQPFAALLIEREIADEIRETVKKMQASNTDAYNWLDHLRKKQHDIYQELGHRWSDVFPRLVIVPRVTVCL
ncbi:MAG: hypothetical protein FWE90_10615 [Defluviitaleaceae bacterium]|nr:hypothetical protein [Defluviitaleaceae bacterium]